MSRLDLSTEDQAIYSRLIAAYRTAAQAAIATARGALDLSEHHAAMQCGVALGKVDNLISNINMLEMMSQQNRDDAVSSNMGTSAFVLPPEDQRLLEELGDQFAQYKAAKEALDTFHKSKAALRAISNNAQDAYLLQQNETYRHITEAKTVLRPLNAIPRTNDEELLIEHLKSCVLYPDRCVELNLELATAEDQAAGIQADYIHQWVTEQDFQDEYDACVTAWDGEFRDLANRTKFLQLLANYSLATEGGGVNYNGSADTQTPNIQSALNAIASVDPKNRQRLLDLSNLMQDFYKKHIKNSRDTAALFRCHLNAARDTLNACINNSREPLNIANHYHHYIQRVTQGLSTINQQEASDAQRQARATAHANAHTQLDYLNLRLQLSNDLQHHHIPASELDRSQTLLQQPFYHRSSQDTIRQEIQEIQEIQYTTAISHLTAASQPTPDQHGAEIRNPLKTIGRGILRDTRAAAALDPAEKPALTRILRSTTDIIKNPTKPEAIANVAKASRSVKNKKIKKHKAKTIWGRIGFGLAAAASFAFAGACAVGIALTGGLLAIPLGAGVIAGVSAGIIASEKAGNYEADTPLMTSVKHLKRNANKARKEIDKIKQKHAKRRQNDHSYNVEQHIVNDLLQKKYSLEQIAHSLIDPQNSYSTPRIVAALRGNKNDADIARALVPALLNAEQTPPQIITLLRHQDPAFDDQEIATGIAAALLNTGQTPQQIITLLRHQEPALDDQTITRGIVSALLNSGSTLEQIIHALSIDSDMTLSTTVHALKNTGSSNEQVAAALGTHLIANRLDGTTLTQALADHKIYYHRVVTALLRNGTSLNQIVNALMATDLDSKGIVTSLKRANISLKDIAHAYHANGASIEDIAGALSTQQGIPVFRKIIALSHVLLDQNNNIHNAITSLRALQFNNEQITNGLTSVLREKNVTNNTTFAAYHAAGVPLRYTLSSLQSDDFTATQIVENFLHQGISLSDITKALLTQYASNLTVMIPILTDNHLSLLDIITTLKTIASAVDTPTAQKDYLSESNITIAAAKHLISQGSTLSATLQELNRLGLNELNYMTDKSLHTKQRAEIILALFLNSDHSPIPTIASALRSKGFNDTQISNLFDKASKLDGNSDASRAAFRYYCDMVEKSKPVTGFNEHTEHSDTSSQDLLTQLKTTKEQEIAIRIFQTLMHRQVNIGFIYTAIENNKALSGKGKPKLITLLNLAHKKLYSKDALLGLLDNDQHEASLTFQYRGRQQDLAFNVITELRDRQVSWSDIIPRLRQHEDPEVETVENILDELTYDLQETELKSALADNPSLKMDVQHDETDDLADHGSAAASPDEHQRAACSAYAASQRGLFAHSNPAEEATEQEMYLATFRSSTLQTMLSDGYRELMVDNNGTREDIIDILVKREIVQRDHFKIAQLKQQHPRTQDAFAYQADRIDNSGTAPADSSQRP